MSRPANSQLIAADELVTLRSSPGGFSGRRNRDEHLSRLLLSCNVTGMREIRREKNISAKIFSLLSAFQTDAHTAQNIVVTLQQYCGNIIMLQQYCCNVTNNIAAILQ